jgi:DNA-binding response OmpR family regulator
MPLFRRAQPKSAGFVLLLEDEPSIRETISRFLAKDGYRVRAVPSVGEALNAINSELQAAILDVILVTSGGRSGLDVLAEIRRGPNGEKLPVLMFTGYGLNPEVQDTIKRFNAELLHKPVELKTLSRWLSEHISQ